MTDALKPYGGNSMSLRDYVLTATLASVSVGLHAQGWHQVGFSGQRLNSATVVGPGSTKPNFQTIAPNVPGALYAIADDGSLLVVGNGGVSSYSRTGKLNWATPFSVVDVAVAPKSGHIYVQAPDSVTALDQNSGGQLWTYSAGFGGETTALTVDSNDVAYLQSGCNCLGGPARISAINPDGSQRWQVFDSDFVRGYIPMVLNTTESIVYRLSTYNLFGANRPLLQGLSTADGHVVISQQENNTHPGAFAPWGTLYDQQSAIAITNNQRVALGTRYGDGYSIDTYNSSDTLIKNSLNHYFPQSMNLSGGHIFSSFPMSVADSVGTLYVPSSKADGLGTFLASVYTNTCVERWK